LKAATTPALNLSTARITIITFVTVVASTVPDSLFLVLLFLSDQNINLAIDGIDATLALAFTLDNLPEATHGTVILLVNSGSLTFNLDVTAGSPELEITLPVLWISYYNIAINAVVSRIERTWVEFADKVDDVLAIDGGGLEVSDLFSEVGGNNVCGDVTVGGLESQGVVEWEFADNVAINGFHANVVHVEGLLVFSFSVVGNGTFDGREFGLVDGCGDGVFDPDGELDGADGEFFEAVVLVVNLALGKDDKDGGVDGFTGEREGVEFEDHTIIELLDGKTGAETWIGHLKFEVSGDILSLITRMNDEIADDLDHRQSGSDEGLLFDVECLQGTRELVVFVRNFNFVEKVVVHVKINRRGHVLFWDREHWIRLVVTASVTLVTDGTESRLDSTDNHGNCSNCE